MTLDTLGDHIRAVLFDFDGTLADSFQCICDSVNYVRSRHKLPPLSLTEVRRFVGHGLAYLLEHTVPDTDLDVDSQAYREHHPSVMLSGTCLMPGAREAIDALCQSGRQLAICSNKPVDSTRKLVRHLGIGDSIDVVVGPEDVPNPKPAPDMLIEAIRRLGVQPDQCLYVGDMVVDIDTARAAGIAVWVVPTGVTDRDSLLLAKPDRLINRLGDLV